MTAKQNLGLQAPDGSTYVTLTDGAGNLGAGVSVTVGDGSGPLTVDGTVAATQSGTWTVQPGNTANTTAWLVTTTAATVGTLSTVASSATSVTVLASNASRKGMAVYNDSTQILYLACSTTTASTSAYTVQIPSGGFFELPQTRDGSVYTGDIKGIWASANGNARVTEWS